MIPAHVLADDQQVRPRPGSTLDGWTCPIDLDPSRDWTGSTFTVDAVPSTITITITPHLDDPAAPSVVLAVTAEQMAQMPSGWFRWNLAEDTVLDRTFLTQTVQVIDR